MVYAKPRHSDFRRALTGQRTGRPGQLGFPVAPPSCQKAKLPKTNRVRNESRGPVPSNQSDNGSPPTASRCPSFARYLQSRFSLHARRALCAGTVSKTTYAAADRQPLSLVTLTTGNTNSLRTGITLCTGVDYPGSYVPTKWTSLQLPRDRKNAQGHRESPQCPCRGTDPRSLAFSN